MHYLSETETAELAALLGWMDSSADDLAVAGRFRIAGVMLGAKQAIRMMATRLTAPPALEAEGGGNSVGDEPVEDTQ